MVWMDYDRDDPQVSGAAPLLRLSLARNYVSLLVVPDVSWLAGGFCGGGDDMIAQDADLRQCAQCGGTGQVILMRTWFIPDGYFRERCGICAGTGHADYPGDAHFNKVQADRRERKV